MGTSVNLSSRETGEGPESAGTLESEQSGFEVWFYDIRCHLVQRYTSEPLFLHLKKIRITSLDVNLPAQGFLYGKASSDHSSFPWACFLNMSSKE